MFFSGKDCNHKETQNFLDPAAKWSCDKLDICRARRSSPRCIVRSATSAFRNPRRSTVHPTSRLNSVSSPFLPAAASSAYDRFRSTAAAALPVPAGFRLSERLSCDVAGRRYPTRKGFRIGDRKSQPPR